MMPEASLRLGVASAAFKKYGKLILANPSLEWDIRRHFFDSLVGGVFFNLALWTPSCKGWEKLETGYALLLRRMLSAGHDGEETFRLSAKDVPALIDAPDLETICRLRRLGFLATLVVVADDSIWAVMQLEGLWCKQICNDLRWLWRFASVDVPFPCADSWTAWSKYIRGRPGHYKAQISKAGHRAAQQQRLETLTLRTLKFLGEWEAPFAQRLSLITSRPFWCGPCGKWFRNKAALASHFFQIHGRVSRYRHVAFGTECQACGKQFGSSQQLALHLRAKTSCCSALAACGLWQHHVLPGIGSAVWNAFSRADLGLKLPSEPLRTVTSVSCDDHVWTENSDLLAALLGGVEAFLEQDDGVDNQGFRFCMHLAEFPLFLEEMIFLARRAEILLPVLGNNTAVHLEETVNAFFHGEVERQSDFDLSEAVLCDSFWQPITGARPSCNGSWHVVCSPECCLLLCTDSAERVQLDADWHGGDWPPGVRAQPAEAATRPITASALRHLLDVLLTSGGWLRAPACFWESDLSLPFVRFHFATN